VRSIKQGEELLVDYGYEAHEAPEWWTSLNGSPSTSSPGCKATDDGDGAALAHHHKGKKGTKRPERQEP
jgi:hypothetical protein